MAEGLVRRVVEYGRSRVVVAFSGGVDSSVVLALAARALGAGSTLAVTAVSPSLPAGEIESARSVARELGVEHRILRTGEVEREAYARNDHLRCYHCKTELYATLRRLADRAAIRDAVLLAGANADDAAEYRPGLVAAGRHGVRNPLLEEGVGKEGVRRLARWLGLPVAEKPALACLASRVAYGVRVTPDLLRRIDRAEREVRALGFGVVRVRHLGSRASIEVMPEDVPRLRSHPGLPGVLEKLHALGWKDVAVDFEGYRPGKLNGDLTVERPGAGRRPIPLVIHPA